MKLIPLNHGKFAKVDDGDFDTLARRKWHVLTYHKKNRTIYYAQASVRKPDGSDTTILMHRIVLGTALGPKDKTDHRDGDGLNNQRYNLRPATTSQNGHNRRKTPGFSSKYKGVSWSSRVTRWKVGIMVHGKHNHLGYFASESEAARAYDVAALKHVGEFALPNLPPVSLAG